MPWLAYRWIAGVGLWAYTSYNVYQDTHEFIGDDDTFSEDDLEYWNEETQSWEKKEKKKKDIFGIGETITEVTSGIGKSMEGVKRIVISGGLLWIVLSTKPWK